MVNTPLDRSEYINLESFKRNGDGVKTPVWCAPVDGTLVVFTNSDSYKVKRIRRDPRVRVARCSASGKVKGDWLEGQCKIVEDAGEEHAGYDALLKKYGWKMRLMNFFSSLGRTKQARTMLKVSLGS